MEDKASIFDASHFRPVGTHSAEAGSHPEPTLQIWEISDMTDRENRLRAARFEKPERIPVSFGMSGACLAHYPLDELLGLKEAHQLLFPGYRKPENPKPPTIEDFAPHHRVGVPYTDSWGCVWETAENGITGAVVEHPLDDWAKFDNFQPPSPEEHDGWGPIDWNDIREKKAKAKENGDLAGGRLRHGHTFLTLTYIRGYENLIFDMIDEHPKLPELIEMVETFNAGLVKRYLDIGVEWMNYPEDLGMQVGPMLGPDQFRKYIKPSYQRLIAPAQEAGCVIHMHSDGDIRQLAADLFDAGIEVINLQDTVNGIDWIEDNLKGKHCVNLDIDRQNVTRFGTPKQIDDHVRHAAETLGSPEGGLMMMYGLYPGVPLENVEALMDAMEKYSTHFS